MHETLSGVVVLLYGKHPLRVIADAIKLVGNEAVMDGEAQGKARASALLGAPYFIDKFTSALSLDLLPQPVATGVVVVTYGNQSITQFSAACHLTGDSAFLCNDTARMAGAARIMARCELLEGLKAALRPHAIHVQREKTPHLSAPAIEWLATGVRGKSSNAIFSTLMCEPCTDGKPIPADPEDLARCRLLLDAIPDLRPRLGEMAQVSDEWSAIVDAWGLLEQTMDEECPDWRTSHNGSARKTYQLLQQIPNGKEVTA